MLNRLPTRQTLRLSTLLDDIGRPPPRAVARALDVSERTVHRWIAADDAPRPVLYALWWLTQWGQCAVDEELRRWADLQSATARCHRDEAEKLRAELARVLAAGDFGCANDPSLAALPRPAAPRPQLQLINSR